MLELFKKYSYNIFITLAYTIIAALVYGVWSFNAWQLWYVTTIIVVVILAIGVFCGWLWIKHDSKKQ